MSIAAARLDCRFTVLLDPTVSAELIDEAIKLGLEPAEHMADILTNQVMPQLRAKDPTLADRLAADARIRAAAGRISELLAKQNGVQHDHTLRVFQELRENHSSDYLRATECKTGFEGGSTLKHRLNLALGAISKRAAHAKVCKTASGLPDKIRNIRGEFCGSVTMLEPGYDSDKQD